MTETVSVYYEFCVVRWSPAPGWDCLCDGESNISLFHIFVVRFKQVNICKALSLMFSTYLASANISYHY